MPAPVAGEPIYLDTGEFAVEPNELTTPDPVIQVRGHTIDLRRSYRSGYAYPGVLGFGWDFAMNRRLRRLDNGNVLITSGTCRTDEYTLSGMGWSAPSGVFRTLQLNANGSYTETSPSGLQDRFDDRGSLIERRDRHGNRIAFEYSEEPMPIVARLQFFVDATPRVVAFEYRLLRIIDPTNREIELSYDPQGRIESITDWIDRTWTYGYDSYGNLTSVTSPPIADYPSGTTTTYAYQDSRFPHKITRVTPPNGQATGTFRVQNFYDAQGRVTRQEDGLGGIFTFTYEPSRTLVNDANGTTRIYTSQNRQITSETVVTRGVRPASVEPVGTQYTTSFQYANDLPTRTVFPGGNATELIYDSSNPNVLARGNLLESRRLPQPGSSAPPLVTRYTYKTLFQQIGTVQDPLGAVTEYFYDGNQNLQRTEYPTVPEGNPVELYGINALGELTSFTDANGNTLKADYDAHGYLDRVTRAFGTSLAATTELDPDAVGRPTVVRDARGNTRQLVQNAWNRLDSTISPTPFQNETEYHYDPSGNLARVEQDSEVPGNPQTTTFSYNVRDWRLSRTNELGQTTTYGYDPNGNSRSTIDPELHPINRIFDERNQVYLETAANGNQVRLHYRPNGHLSSVVDGNSHATLYGYDDLDRQNLITHAGSSTEGRTYDAAANMISSKTRSGDTFSYTYDALHRMRSRTTPEEVATFSFDLGGRMVGAVNPAASLVFGYNARNELESESTTLPGLSTRVVAHQYDGAGNRTRKTYPDGTFLTYVYDELDRLESLRDGSVQEMSGWSYDELSRPTTRVLPSGVSSAWTYDRASRVATIAHTGPGGVLDSRVYGRDPTGTITSVQDLLGAHAYGYDASKQLTSVNYPVSSPFADTGYAYDAAGNRLSETASSATAYVPNALNQYASIGGVQQAYDTNGNLTDDGQNAHTFDSQNRLVSALPDDGAGGTLTVSYAYDAFMRRTRKTVDGLTTFFLWSASELVEEYNGAGTREMQYIYGSELSPVHVRVGSSETPILAVHAGHLSTPDLITDASGTMIWRASYHAFAKAAVDPTALDFNMRFPGQYEDPETGLHYSIFRYYSAKSGRYMSPDPIGQASGVNLYAYVFNDPLSWMDPLGLDGLHVCDRPTAGPMPGNHAYLWDPESPENPGSTENPEGRNEGRGGASSGGGRAQSRELPRTNNDACRSVPGTEGKEEEILKDLNDTGNHGPWIPFVNDCHNSINRSLKRHGAPPISSPNGRFGRSDAGATKPPAPASPPPKP